VPPLPSFLSIKRDVLHAATDKNVLIPIASLFLFSYL